MKAIELLAPAKNLACGIAAIEHGADAVYIGAQRFGARAAAGNSVDDIAELCRYAHQFGAKVYVTVNTIIYDDELEDTRRLMEQLRRVGADAFLVQDMGIASPRSIPVVGGREVSSLEGASLHASTQTDNRTAEKVRWLRSLGFSRVVLARELSIREIAEIHREVPDVELEVFVHGALCVSYSGICYASQYCFGRSANRGACAQFCRLKFDLKDSEGNVIEHQRHLLSLRDMCRIDYLEELIEAGACSFKIEGRLKDVGYVKNVVAAYSQRLDEIVARHPDSYRRASFGRTTYFFTPDLKKTFNRGFTNYFLHGRQGDITSFDTPKAMGEYVGRVKEIRRNMFTVAGTAAFANGDGLCFFNDDRQLEGFRVNRAEGNRLFPLRMPDSLQPGTALYRNQDVAFEKLLSGKTAERKIPLVMQLAESEDGFLLTVSMDIRQSSPSEGRQPSPSEDFQSSLSVDRQPFKASASIVCEKQLAQKPQRENIIRQLTKLGNTPYCCDHIEIDEGADKYFIPSSMLAELRRKAIMAITPVSPSPSTQDSVPSVPQDSVPSAPQDSVPSVRSVVALPQQPLPTYPYPYMYNIANRQARAFYEAQGLHPLAPAFELSRPREAVLMQCRHCLRYALGCCVKHGGQKPSWREPLYLELPDRRRFRLEFDCKHCQMNIYAE
ncbi:MAG: DUF3656 domain-containing protein [Prevotella sp.]|nr:DUF3656 domain-containing protein [Prevotella sp.]